MPLVWLLLSRNTSDRYHHLGSGHLSSCAFLPFPFPLLCPVLMKGGAKTKDLTERAAIVPILIYCSPNVVHLLRPFPSPAAVARAINKRQIYAFPQLWDKTAVVTSFRTIQDLLFKPFKVSKCVRLTLRFRFVIGSIESSSHASMCLLKT